MSATKEQKRRNVNSNLITLKIIVFFTFVGFANIHLLNTLLPFYLGLNFDEYRLITIIAPIVSIIGPLVVGPLADHLAAKNPSKFGRCLRILTAVCLIISAILYAVLIFIPRVERQVARRPYVNFGCNENGGMIFQNRCDKEKSCHHWSKKHGDLVLNNCSYTCQSLKQFEKLYLPWMKASQQTLTNFSVYMDPDDYSEEDSSSSTTQATFSYPIRREKRTKEVKEHSNAKTHNIKKRSRGNNNYAPTEIYVKPPHLCEKQIRDNGTEHITKCHVYTEHTESLKVKVTLRGSTNDEESQATDSEGICYYPVDGFVCEIPQDQVNYMASVLQSPDCKPMVECDLIDPYDLRTSVLADTVCIETTGDLDVTLITYFVLRPIAAIFLMAALALLNTAMVIATRETSTGRGEICRQYVWGALAWTCFIPSLLGFKEDIYKIHDTNYLSTIDDLEVYLIALVVVAFLSLLIAAAVLLFDNQMPLSPPEWWWHTKTGMLVYPMSAIRKYFPEMLAVCLITLILGIFWSSIYSYTPWVYKDWNSITYIGCILLLLLFFNVDKFIEYCSHSNILIAVFALYIIRFTGLHINDDDTTLTIIMEIIEPFYVIVAWITVILYMRHVIPRKYTATGQAALVAAHFCLGKCFGALFGLEKDEKQPEKSGLMYQYLTIIACVISLLYFILYNLILAPNCTAKPQPAPQLTLTNLSQQQPNNNTLQTNGANGNYTPLRVYHNERGKKGQFRY